MFRKSVNFIFSRLDYFLFQYPRILMQLISNHLSYFHREAIIVWNNRESIKMQKNIYVGVFSIFPIIIWL